MYSNENARLVVFTRRAFYIALPIKREVKEFTDKAHRRYVAMALESMEKGDIGAHYIGKK